MAFDFKTACPALYRPGRTPELLAVPPLRFLSVQGERDPNQPDGAYQKALAQLYTVAYTLKHSRPDQTPGYFDFVVPPLESLWRQDGAPDPQRKQDFCWQALLRLPDFVTEQVFARAIDTAARKKGKDVSAVTLFSWEEGLCVQALHLGPYEQEAETCRQMVSYAQEKGYAPDLSPTRRHHEIYLSDPRRCLPHRRKTILRLPVRPL